MPGYRLIVLLLLFYLPLHAQQKSDKELLDSLLANDPLLRELDSAYQPQSYGSVSLGIGNRIFSLRNNRLNTLQSDGKLVVTPAVGYYNKSGFGMSASASALSDAGKFSFYQYSLTPSYDYSKNENFSAGISYTRYFTRDEFSASTSPVKNDVYAYGVYKKPWLSPLLSLGYANGSLNEIMHLDTVIGPTRIRADDTIRTSIHSFTLTAGLEHNFHWYNIIGAADAISLRPQFLLNLGSDTYKTTHTGSSTFFNLFTKRKSRINRSSEQMEKSGLQFQSIAFALSADYGIKDFYLRPNIYLDYYLPQTTEKRMTSVFSLTLGLML